MSEEIKVSVCIVTFNHERYIRRAIESVLMQKVNFPIEILVGDDCSQDKTPEILKEYEGKYPNLRVILRQENLWGTPDNNSWRLRSTTRGKYVIVLEGDDFWLDTQKLQKQVDFLDRHPDFIAVAHRCVVVGDDSAPIDEVYPECNDAEYTIDHFASNILPGQTTTVMYRNIYRGVPEVDLSILHKGLIPGDRLLNFVLLCYGRVGCLPDRMTAYRHVTTHGSSFSATFRTDFHRDLHWLKELLTYAKKVGTPKAVIAVEIFLIGYYRGNLFGAHSQNRLAAWQCWLQENIQALSYLKYVEGLINRKIFHKQLSIKL